MIAAPRQRQLVGMLLFVMVGLALIVASLLPLSPGAIRWPGPDWLLALTFAWVARRPDHVPVLVIAVVLLVADILTMQPIGLHAAATVVATEAVRQRQERWSGQGFLAEWLRVAALMALMLLAERFLRTIFIIPSTLAPMPPLGQDVMRLIATVAAYPIVVAVCRVFGLRRAAPGELDLI